MGGDMSERLDEPFAPPPFVFAEEHATELGEPFGRIVEDAEDRLPFGDRERGHSPLSVVCVLNGLGGVVEAGVAEPAGELEYEPVVDRDAGQHHEHDHTFGLWRV
jgi:hypothetical protein